MPLFSAFTPFGHLRYSSAASRFETIYRTMRDGEGATDGLTGGYGPGDSLQESRTYALARCFAIADGQLERARNEGRASKTQEFLGDMERDHGLAPASTQTDAQRRAALELQIKILRGSRKESIDDALTTVLGSDFVDATPASVITSPPNQFPATPASAGIYSLRAKWRVYTMSEDTALTGVRHLTFVDVIAGQDPLAIGDKIVIDPKNMGLTESVTVSAITAAATVDANKFTTNHVTVTVTNAHDAGTVCTTAPFPLLTSTQRHILIRVSASAAYNPVKRAAVDALMRRYLRGVTTWEIQVANTGGGTPDNQLTLDDAVKGRLDGYVVS